MPEDILIANIKKVISNDVIKGLYFFLDSLSCFTCTIDIHVVHSLCHVSF